ncbi:MAG: hypothetical protein ABEK50_04725, partial [bacterium]
MVFMTFLGEPGDEERVSHAHESPLSMTLPMAVLGVFCFAFFFQAGPPTGSTGDHSSGHGSDKHAALEIGPQLVTSAQAASEKHGSEGHGKQSKHGNKGKHEKHGKESNGHKAESGGHGGGHGGWFEALITNPDPVKHYSGHQHSWAAGVTGTLSMIIAGGGILLAAVMYANIIWVGTAGVLLALLSLTINLWVWIVLLLLTGAGYWAKGNVDFTLPESLLGVKKILAAKFYFDEFYRDSFVTGTLKAASISAWIDAVIIDGIVNAAALFLKVGSAISGAIDNVIVDGMVDGVATILRSWGDRLRKLQTGEVQWYLNIIAFGLGAVLLTTVLFL